MKPFLPAIAAAAFIVMAANATAQTAEEHIDRCLKSPSKQTLDVVIESCSYVIRRRIHPVESLARAYFNRGFSYGETERHQLAIADFDEAIRLQPDNARTYLSRCRSRALLDQMDLAVPDCERWARTSPLTANQTQDPVLRAKALALLYKNERVLKMTQETLNRPLPPEQYGPPPPGIPLNSVAPVSALLATADAAKCKKLYEQRCMICHGAAQAGGQHRIGPNLWNTLGSTMGRRPGYRYSKAMEDKAVVLDYETLNKFLGSPREFVPGTKQAFIGVPGGQDRADLIAYLRTQHDNPSPLPK